MSDAFETAAMAFDNDAAPASSAPARQGRDGGNTSVENMFPNMGILDDDSPEAGGDNLPIKGKKAPKQEVDEDDDPELAGLVADDEEGDDGEASDEEGDPEDDDAQEEDEDPEYEVTVEGETAKVKLSEALSGYIRQETFHRRLNVLEDVKQTLIAEANSVIEDKKKYQGLIETMQKHLDLVVPAEPNWDEEYRKDPVEARKLQKAYESLTAQKNSLAAEAERVAKETEEASAREYAKWKRQEDAKILKNNPDWADPEKGEKNMVRDLTHMSNTAIAAGFSNTEIQSIVDSRMITILRKAAKYDRIVASKPKEIHKGKKPPVNNGAVPSSRSAAKGQNKAMSVLRKTGSVEAAASVFTSLISKRR